METGELEHIAKEIDLFAAAEDSEALLAKLEDLNQRFTNPTKENLKKTSIGVKLNKLQKSSKNKEISGLAKKLVTKWKETILKDMKKQQKDAAESPTKSKGKKAEESTTETDLVEKAPGKPRNADIDGADCEVYEAPAIRNKVLKAFYNCLAADTSLSSGEVFGICKALEKAIYHASTKLTGNYDEKAYTNRYRLLFSNMISKKNKDLKVKILRKNISMDWLMECEAKDLAPAELKKKLAKIDEENLFNAQGPVLERAATDRFQCGKCKQRKASYYQMQTRSADEPLTTFVECLSCGNRWKFS